MKAIVAMLVCVSIGQAAALFWMHRAARNDAWTNQMRWEEAQRWMAYHGPKIQEAIVLSLAAEEEIETAKKRIDGTIEKLLTHPVRSEVATVPAEPAFDGLLKMRDELHAESERLRNRNRLNELEDKTRQLELDAARRESDLRLRQAFPR